MFYTIYKITNQINGKFYIGSHKTRDLNDAYMGSGKYLKYAQEKFGLENFSKEILFVCDTAEEMYAKEAELVTVEFLAEENTYNLKVGGFGGFDYVNYSGKNISWKDPKARCDSISLSLKERLSNDSSLKDVYTKNLLSGANKSIKTRSEKYPNGTFVGKTHTSETKAKIGLKTSLTQKGDNNSQYGTRWIHSLEFCQSKRIKKTDPLPDGWIEGRKINF